MRKFIVILSGIACIFMANGAEAKTEPWYWGFSLGGGSTTFSDTKADAISLLATSPGYSSMTLGSEIYFYWPVTNTAIVGFVSGGASKAFSNATSTSMSQSFGQSLLSASWLQTIGKEPGEGLLFRIDAGYGMVYQTSGTSFFSYSNMELGPAVRGGLGFGFSVGTDTRLMVLATAGAIIRTGTPHYYAISLGPLF